jgi:hypothetical protein
LPIRLAIDGGVSIFDFSEADGRAGGLAHVGIGIPYFIASDFGLGERV